MTPDNYVDYCIAASLSGDSGCVTAPLLRLTLICHGFDPEGRRSGAQGGQRNTLSTHQRAPGSASHAPAFPPGSDTCRVQADHAMDCDAIATHDRWQQGATTPPAAPAWN